MVIATGEGRGGGSDRGIRGDEMTGAILYLSHSGPMTIHLCIHQEEGILLM